MWTFQTKKWGQFKKCATRTYAMTISQIHLTHNPPPQSQKPTRARMEQHNPNKSCEQIPEKKLKKFGNSANKSFTKLLQVVVHWHSLQVSYWTKISQHLHIQFTQFSIQIYTHTLKTIPRRRKGTARRQNAQKRKIFRSLEAMTRIDDGCGI